MVYKKYVYKRGKRHGPYYYHSYRDGESVRKVYIGGKEEYGEWLKKRQENKEKSRTTFQLPFITKKKYSLIIPIAILLIIIGFVIYNYQITGKASLDIQNSYIAGENISGVLKLGLKKGELLPIDSKIVIEQEGVIKEYPLAQFVNANSEGKFFIENTELSGNGLGYGFSGEKETYPAVFFRLKIYSEQETKKEPEEPTKKPEENITEEKPSEEIIETPEETTKPEATTETPTEESEVSKSEITKTEEETGGSLITGEVISETAEEEEEIEESCSKDNPFVYQLGAGKSAEIKQGSVEIETFDENGNTIREKISENAVNLQISDSQANVTTDYSITKGGFGQEFLTDEQEFLEISLKDLGIIAEQGILKISLVYEDKTLVEVSEEISVEQPAERKIEEIENETVVTPTENITAGENTTLIENITEINITITNLTLIKAIPEIEIAKNSNFSLDLNEYFANAESYSIEKIENISVTPQKNILTIIPDINFIGERQARVIANRENESVESNLFNIIVYETNITITTIQEKAVIGRPVRWKKSVKLEKPENITIKLPKEAKEINVYKFTEKDKDVEIEEDITSRLTGQITAELDLEKEGILTRLWKKLISSLTGRAIAEINESEEIEVMLQENATEYEITYETEAPQAYEENITNGKRIIVSGPDALHYENVLAYTNINEIVSVENKDKIKLYWLKETGKEQEIGKEQEQEENLSAGQLIENISEEINISKIENITEEVNVSLQKITDETIQTQEKTSETFDSTGLITGQAVLEENITGETSETNGSESNLLINESNESIAEQVGQGIKEVIREIVNINETQEQISQQIIRKEINFTAYDLDNDGMIDYIEWNAERLSNQTYELIIEISKAEHLDENRTFLSDVYEQVKALDNNWSEPINNNEYVRVTFERNLTRDRDITIYARSADNNSAEIEVYIENSNETIAKFENIKEENWYKVYLTNLSESYDNETQILTLDENGEEEWKYFYELNKNEKVATLNQDNRELEYQNPIEYQEFDYDDDMYKIELEDGSNLLVSEKHKVYVSYAEERGSTVNLSSYNVMNLPSKSSDLVSLSNLENEFNNNSGLSCGVLNQTIENIVSLLYRDSSVKSQSLVTNTLCSDLENSDNLPLSSCLGLKITSKSFLRNCSNSFLTFSSSRNLSFLSFDVDDNIVSSFNKTSCIMQSCFDMLFCEGYKECIKNFFCWNSSFEHLQDLPDHDSCAFESGLSMTDIAVCNNILIDFNSHCEDINNNDYLSFSIAKNLLDFKLQPITETYEEIKQGKELYFLDAGNNPVRVRSIEKQDYDGKIYDVDVENDIVLVRRNKRVDNLEENSIKSQNINDKDSDNLNDKLSYKDDTGELEESQTLLENRQGKKIIREKGVGEIIREGIAVWSGNSDSQDVFDLRVVDGSVEFDYIVDPPDEEILYVDSYTGTRQEWTTRNSPSPYLADETTGYIHEDKTASAEEGNFGFANTTTDKTGVIAQTFLYFEAYGDDNNDGFNVYLDSEDGSGFVNEGSITITSVGSYDWFELNVTSRVNTWSEVDALSMYLDTWNGGAGDDRYVRRVYLNVSFFPDETPPTVNLISPVNYANTSASVTFNCTQSNDNLKNATLYGNWSLGWHANETKTITGTSNETTFAKTLTEGNYIWNCYACDIANNCAFNATNWTFSVDTNAPLVTIVRPETITYTTSSIPFNFTLNEAGTCLFSLNTGVTNYTMTANASNTGFNATNTSIADGSYTTTAYCNDTAGNKNYTTTKTFSKDSTAPLINVVSPTNGTAYATTTVQFNVTLNEAGNWCGFSLDSTANITMTTFNTTYFNYTNSTMTQGNHNVTFSCNDTAGNMNASSGVKYFDVGIYSVTDAQNNAINVTIKFLNMSNHSDEKYSDGGEKHTYNVSDGQYDIKIIPANSTIFKEIILYNASFNSSINGLISIDDPSEAVNDLEVYAINPLLSYSIANITINASLNEVYKCAEWNFTNQTPQSNCTWTKVKDITKGQLYNITLTPNDPGYAEIANAVQCYSAGSSVVCSESEVNTSNNVYAYSSLGYLDSYQNLLAQARTWHNKTDIPDGSTIDAVNVTIEWYVADTAETCGVYVYKNSTNEWINLSAIGSGGCQGTEAMYYYNAFPYITTEADAENIQIIVNYSSIAANDASSDELYVDYIVVSVNYSAPDTIAPFVYLESPANNTQNTTTNTIDFYYNVSDSSSIANCSLMINYLVNVTASSPTKDTTNNLTTYLANGNYWWSVNCTDSVNNQNGSQTRNISINVVPDTTFPNVTLNSPANASTQAFTNTTFNCTSYDNTALKNVTLYFNGTGGGGGGTITLVQNKSNATVYTNPVTTFGLTLSSVAIAGNLLVTGISIDKNSGAITVPDGFTMIQTGSSTTAGTGVSGAFAFKIAAGGEQTITWTWANSKDATMWVGEYNGTATSDVLDVSAENESKLETVTASLSTGANTTTQANELAIAVFESDSGNSVGTPASWSWTNGFATVAYYNLSSGSPYIHIASKTLSSTGEVESTFSHGGSDESYAAIATFKAAAGATAWHENETKTITGLNNETTFQVNLTDNQTYAWNCRACDNNNNCNFSVYNWSLNINTSYGPDATAPVINVVSPANATTYTTTTIYFNVTLNEAGSWCGFSLNGAANVTMTAFNTTYFNFTNSTMTDNMQHNVTFACNDTLGNMNSSSGMTYFTVNTTDQYPSVTLNSPTNATTLNYTTIDFNFTATDNYNLTNATLYFCNVTTTSSEQPTEVEWIANRSTWYYNDSDVLPSSNWMNTSTYLNWPSGPSYLATSAETAPPGVNTTLTMGAYAYITYYFMRNFTITDATKINNMSFDVDYDDAYVVWINGYLINTSNSSCDWNTHSALCLPYPHNSLIDTSGATAPYRPVTLLNSTQLDYLITGVNNISVAIKQGATTSSDAAFELRLYGNENQTSSTKACDSNGFTANTTITLSGTTNTTNITQIMFDNRTYWWNIYVCDNASQCSFNNTNYTLYVNTSYSPPAAPEVYPTWCAFHFAHTDYSDGPSNTQDEFTTKMKQYYDCGGTNDHDTSLDQTEWTDWINRADANNSDNNFTYFFGAEWTGSQHIYYITLNPSYTQQDAGDAGIFSYVANLTKWMQQNTSVGQYNHPARTSGGTDFSNSANVNETWIPLVEMINNQGGTYYWHWNYYWNCSAGSGCTTYTNPKGTGLQTATGTGWVKVALDQGYHIGFSCGNDKHEDVTTWQPECYTGLANPYNFTRGGVYYTLKARHTWAAENKTWMSVTANNGSDTKIMGDIFSYASSTPNITINYRINATAGNTIVNVSLFHNGTIVNVSLFSGQQNISGSFIRSLNSDGVEEYLFVEAIQSNGQRAWSSPMWINYTAVTDNAAPIISVVSPTNGTTYATTIVQFNVSLNENGSWCGFSLDHAANITMTAFNTTYFNFTNSTMTQGNHNVTFSCNDTAGNMNASSGMTYFSVDSIAPYVFLEAPTNNTINTTDSTPDFKFNVTENLDASIDCLLWLRNSTNANVSYGRNETTLNATSTTITANATLANGDYWWHVNCSDGTNTNVSEIRNISMNVATPHPGINFTSPTPSNGTTTSNTSIEINVSIIRDTYDLDEVKWDWNGTNYTIYNSSEIIFKFNFDNLSALGETDSATNLLIADTGKYSNNAKCMGNCPDVVNNGKYGNAYKFSTNNNNLSIKQNSVMNNNSVYTIMGWFNMTSAGTTANTGTGGMYAYPIITKGMAESENNSEDISYFIGVNATNRLCADYENITNSKNHPVCGSTSITLGQWYHFATIKNSSGLFVYLNAQLDGSNLLAISPPTLSSIALTGIGVAYTVTPIAQSGVFNGLIDNIIMINRSLSVQEIQQHYFSNLQKYTPTQWYLYVNQSKNSTTGLDLGAYTYFASAKDTEGNENITETRTITIQATADETAPIITVVSPTNGTTYATTIVQFNVSLNENGSWCGFSLDHAANITMTAFNTTYFNFTNSTMTDNKKHNVTFACNDTLGNMNSSSGMTYFTVNTTDQYPSVTLNSPTNYQNLTETNVTFNCSATDDRNIANVTLYGNWSLGWHANETKTITGTSNESTFQVNFSSNGTWLWNCLAYDNASQNKFASANYTFSINTTASSQQLSVTINSPANESNVTTPGWALLNWSIINATEAWVYGSNTSSLVGSGNSLLYHRKGLTDGEYTYNWTARVVQPDSSTVLLLHFDNLSDYGENSTLVKDFSNFGNNGTCSGASCPAFGPIAKLGGKYSFDGGDVWQIPDSGSLDGLIEFTIMGWINVTGDGTVQTSGTSGCESHYPFITKGHGIAENSNEDLSFYIGIHSTANTICFDIENTTSKNHPVSSTTAFNDGELHFFAAVSNGSDNLIYVDGVLENTATMAGQPTQNNWHDVGIGRSCNAQTCTYGAFVGNIEEIAIFNRTLSSEEIASYYNLTLGRKHYWLVNVTDGTNYADSSVYEFNLTTEEVAPDNNPPNITIYSPANDGQSTYYPLLNWTINDSSSFEAKVFLSNDTSTMNDSLVYYSTSLSTGNFVYNLTSLPISSNYDASLTALWHFDQRSDKGESASVILDYSSVDTTQENLSCGTSCPTITNSNNAKFGRAYEFGTNKHLYAESSDEIRNSSEYTIVGWFNMSGDGTAVNTGSLGMQMYPIITKGMAQTEVNDYDIYFFVGVNSTNKFLCADYENITNSVNHPVCGNTQVNDNKWHHFAVVKNSTNLVVYLDGAQNGIRSATSAPTLNSTIRVGIGVAYTSTPAASGAWNGLIDDLAFFNRSMSASEILNLYNISTGTYYWRVEANDTSGNYNASFTYNFNLVTSINSAPNQPTINSPINGSTVTTSTNTTFLNVTVSDPEADIMNVTFYAGIHNETSKNFTIVFISDTHFTTITSEATGINMTNWTVNNKTEKNIIFLVHTGDITSDNTDAQMNASNNSMSILDNRGVAWFILPGNHDYSGTNYDNYTTYYNYSRFTSYSWYSGYFNGTNRNSYGLFEVDGFKIGVINLEDAPGYDVLAWANSTVSSNSDYKFIVASHNILDTSGVLSADPYGTRIWNGFAKWWSNIFMMHSGHVTSPVETKNLTLQGVNGNNVSAFMTDYQEDASPGIGKLRYYIFDPSADQIYAYTYAINTGAYDTDSSSKFNFSFDMPYSTGTSYSIICSNGSVNNNSIVTCNYTDLVNNTAYDWYVKVQDNYSTTTSPAWNFTYNYSIPVSNTAPNTPSPNLVSLDGSNKTSQDLNCSATISDPDGNALNVSVQWYRNKIINLTLDYNNSYANASSFSAILDDGNTTKLENWTCGMRFYDGNLYSNWANSTDITILNTLPTISLTSPENGNITTNRTPTFSWSGSDDDNDSMQYEINITCWAAGSIVTAGSLYKDKTIIGGTASYTASPYLKCLSDNNQIYNWTARAWDGEEYGSWASERNISVQSEITIDLSVSNVNFGSLNLSQSENTTDETPSPLVLENSGNAEINISINASDLWLSVLNPSSYFQYKIRNTSAGCFIATGTQTTWANVPNTTTISNAINRFNFTSGYQTGCSNTSIDLLVSVPSSEPPGDRESTITFISSLAEPKLG